MAESSQSDEKLDLKVSDSHGALTHFKVKKTTKFRKILTAYASKAGIEERAIRLMVDGERVNLEQCPGDLDMENGDQIDAMVEQQGAWAKTRPPRRSRPRCATTSRARPRSRRRSSASGPSWPRRCASARRSNGSSSRAAPPRRRPRRRRHINK